MQRWRQWWSEVRRRRVLRVALYYLAGAWVLAQVADLLFDAFGWADHTRFVIAALVAGLPVALVLAWLFDITPHGIERTLALLPGAERAAAADGEAVRAPTNSVAVLPFANLSRDPADEYFSDGLAEEIRNQLARVAGLRVAARTSSFAFKGRHEDVRTIGRRLNVARLLEGGVRRHEDRVRIDVQLVDAADGYQVWSQTFERELGDVFRLQSEVSAAVIAAVGDRTGPALQAPPTDTAPACFEAYSAYLLGRFHFHKRTEPSLARAAELFRKAVTLDPAYALAYTGMADTSILLSVRHYGNLPLEAALASAQPAVATALRLAPNLAEAHASLGLVRLNIGDAAGASAAFERAIALDPGYAMAHVWLSLALLAQGHYAEAARRNLLVYRLDPLSPIVVTNTGFDALRFGRDDEARARFAAAIELDPQFPVPCSGMSRLHASRGDVAGALRWIARAVEIAPTRAFYRARQALQLLQGGDPDAAARALEAARALAPDSVFDTELDLAWCLVRRDMARLETIASGAAGPCFSAATRGYAQVALGRSDQARATYAGVQLDPRREIDGLLDDDWIWRLPHTITRAHLWLEAGDRARGTLELEAFLACARESFDEGVVNGDLRYWCTTACLLLAQEDAALTHLATAVDGGWRHGWWSALDWNLAAWKEHPRVAALLARVSLTTTTR